MMIELFSFVIQNLDTVIHLIDNNKLQAQSLPETTGNSFGSERTE